MSSIKGKTICFTGALQSQTRAQASKAATAAGAKVAKSVTNNVDIVVCADGAGAKKKAAEDKGCEIWTEDDFVEAVGGTPAPSSPAKKAATPKKATPKKATPKKATPVKSAPSTPAPPKKKTKIEPATPAIAGSGKRKVMSAIQNGHEYSVHEDYDVKLMLSDQTSMNSNKFYKLQLLVNDSDQYFVATNWGRLGEPGRSQLKGPHDEEKGIAEFGKVFRSKTRNDWGATPFVRHGDKYQLVETTIDEEGEEGQALGRLTESQILKGQEVLKEIREKLEANETTSSGRRKRKTRQEDEVGALSNSFYSLIPTRSGRQRPPLLDNLEIVTEKEGLLEFWLRMGFEEVSPQDVDGSPIAGVHELPVPKTLKAAAASVADKHSIDSSCSRGKELAKSKAGDPVVDDMDPELYAAILLYTGNSIYRELNRCLRVEWKGAKKYWNYLRLYFEAANALPKKEVTLWRGIAADLFDEYQPGKIIKWWTVSSCTSDKSVAENFMSQLGSKATLLTLKTKTACDISGLSFYPHEQESLLSPGVKLRVLSRKRNGNVAEIEVEEVLDDDEEEDSDKKPAAK